MKANKVKIKLTTWLGVIVSLVNSGGALFASAQKNPSIYIQRITYFYKEPLASTDQAYDVDRNLNLTFRRRYEVLIKPALRFSQGSYHSQQEYVLREGSKFRLELFFTATVGQKRAAQEGTKQSTPFDDQRLISAFSGEVEVRNGQISTEVPLAIDFADQSLLEVKNQVFISLSALDGPLNQRPKPALAWTRFIPLGKETHTSDLSQIDSSRRSLFAALVPMGSIRRVGYAPGLLYKPFIPSRQSPFEKFLRYASLPKSLSTVDLGDRNQQLHPRGKEFSHLMAAFIRNESYRENGKLTPLVTPFCNEFSDIADSLPDELISYFPKPGFSSMLMRGWRTPRSESMACRLRPELFYDVKVMKFVEQIRGISEPLDSITHEQELTANFIKERTSADRNVLDGHQKSRAKELHARFGYGSGTSKFGISASTIFSFVLRDIRYWGTEISVTDEDSRRLQNTHRRVLVSDALKLAMNAMVRTCVLIQAKRTNARGALPPSYLFCLVQPQTITETWYYFRDRFITIPSSAQKDPSDLTSTVWNTLIRGERQHAKFQDLITKQNLVFEMKEIATVGDELDPLLRSGLRMKISFFRDGGIFPGVVEFSENARDLFRVDIKD